jgi:hypothetical protein
MAANISSVLSDWSVTPGSNQPDGTDTADLDAEFQAIQAAVRKYVRAIGADIASGSTVNLANATGEFVSVTGEVGIASFGTVGAGMRFIIRFVSSLTLTHNATSLICPAGADLTVNANDIIWLESLGSGNWRILSYMPVQATRTWQDMSASRALDTEYTNTNSYPIEVSLSVISSSSQVGVSLFVAGLMVCYVTISSAIQAANLSAVVPPGSTYKLLTNTGTYTIGHWAELS